VTVLYVICIALYFDDFNIACTCASMLRATAKRQSRKKGLHKVLKKWASTGVVAAECLAAMPDGLLKETASAKSCNREVADLNTLTTAFVLLSPFLQSLEGVRF